MSINHRIKEVRSALKLSQIDFAKDIAISNGYYAEIELGNRKANDRIIKLICLTFGVNEEWLRTGKGEMYIDNSGNDTLSQQAQDIFTQLKPEYRKFLYEQMKLLLNIQENEKK